jgi:formylglycine-generating enzyme required for sulfatase activity
VLRADKVKDNSQSFNVTIANGGTNWFKVEGPFRPVSAQWQHIALVRTPHAVSLYWNGQLYATKRCKDERFVACPSNLFLGVRKNGEANRFISADIRAFRVSRTALYQDKFTPPKEFDKTADTLLLSDFSAMHGAALPDRSGCGHPGQVSAQWARLDENKGAALPTKFKNKVGMEFVLVPRGKSWLGGGGGKPGDKEVVIPHDFYLGKYEVTQKEWQKVMGNNPSAFARNGKHKDAVRGVPDKELGRFPVESVSWVDVQSFLDRVNNATKETGWKYRLPTEVEWEYACRGGPMTDKKESAFDFYFDKPTNGVPPGNENPGGVPPGKGNLGNILKRTCKVGSFKPNRLGLYDMHGNVWEWCDDLVIDPTDPKQTPRRVYRGASWEGETAPPTALRHYIPQSFPYDTLGLRLARVPVARVPINGEEVSKITYLYDLTEVRLMPPEVVSKNYFIKQKQAWLQKSETAPGFRLHPAENGGKGWASVTYRIDKRYQTFQATVGIDASVPNGRSGRPITFIVRGDGRLLWKSRPLQKVQDSAKCTISVSGVTLLELRTQTTKIDFAWATWVGPRLRK